MWKVKEDKVTQVGIKLDGIPIIPCYMYPLDLTTPLTEQLYFICEVSIVVY